MQVDYEGSVILQKYAIKVMFLLQAHSEGC